MFEKAYERIISEFQIVLNLSLENTQKKLDKALKRNLSKGETTNQKIQKTDLVKESSEDLNNEEDNSNLDNENEQE